MSDMPEKKFRRQANESSEIKKLLAWLPGYGFEDGLLKRISNNKIMALANFIPVPLEETLYDDGRTPERYFTVKAIKQNGENLPPVKVKASSMTSMSWVEDCWGFSANIEPPIQSKKDYIRHVIFTLGEKLADKRTIYTHTGWRLINGSYVYLYHNGAIGGQNVSVELEGNLKAYEMKSCVELSEGIQAVRNLFEVASANVIYPLISITFLSPLNEFFRIGGCEPAFVLYLLGRTQTKKSTIAALMLSFFGRFTSSNLPSSFKDTANAIEKKCCDLKDILTVIDDFHPVTNYRDKQNMEQIAQSLARGYGDRTARERMSSDIAIRPGYPPRGNAIITGEDFPNIGQSGSARVFIIEMSADDIPNSDTLSHVQEQAWNGCLIAVMRHYIKWLIPQTDKLPERLKTQFLLYRQKAACENISGYGRTGDIIAWLQIGFEFFLTFLQSIGAADQKTLEQMKEKAWRILCGLSKIQLEKSNEDRPTALFINTLKELLDTGKVYVKFFSSDKQNKDERGTHIGFQDEDYFYFLPAVTYNEIMKFFMAQNEIFPLTKTRLIKQMAAENLIYYDKSTAGNSYTVRKRIGNEKRRFLVMSKKTVLEST